MESRDWRAEKDPLDAAAALIPRVLRDRAIFPLYQPIMDLATRMVVGVEALARGPAGSPVEVPAALFAAASRAGLVPLVDQLCFARAVEVAREKWDLAPPLLFTNAEPTVLNRPLAADLLAALRSQRPFRIVLEFTERALSDHPAAMLSLANIVHRDGDALALDDVGADPLSLAFLPLVEPEVVKLDKHLLRNPYAGSAVETAAIVNAYAERTGAVVLAEGIETEEDLGTARALGARWGQGWLFGRPGPLSAIAGWPVHRHAGLRPPRADLHLPSDTPFSKVAALHASRVGDQRMVDGLTDYLLSVATTIGSHAVVLGAYPDPAVGQRWLPRLAAVADTAAFVGIVGPALAGANQHPVRVATAPAARPAGSETVLTVVGPHAAVALCVRPGDGGPVQYVLTHEPNVAVVVARMLLWRLGTTADRSEPPAGGAGPRQSG